MFACVFITPLLSKKDLRLFTYTVIRAGLGLGYPQNLGGLTQQELTSYLHKAHCELSDSPGQLSRVGPCSRILLSCSSSLSVCACRTYQEEEERTEE